jgi:preprotein translocase subunit YajC
MLPKRLKNPFGLPELKINSKLKITKIKTQTKKKNMLFTTIKVGESIVINDNINVKVSKIKNGNVVIAINAPKQFILSEQN